MPLPPSFASFQFSLRPYRARRIEAVSRNMLITLIASFYLLLYLTYPGIKDSVQVTIGVLIIVINSVLLAFFLVAVAGKLTSNQNN